MNLLSRRGKLRSQTDQSDAGRERTNGGPKPRRHVPAGVILGVALVQLAHLVYFDPFVGLYGDTVGYVYEADTIFGWRSFISNYQPLYPAFVKLTMLLSDPEHFRRLLALLQLGMMVATCLLIYRLVLELTERPWLATIAAFLVALDIRITIYEYLALTEIPAIFLSVLFIYASFRALVGGGWRWAATAGLSLLALALTKYSCASLVFAAALISIVLARRYRNSAISGQLHQYTLAVCVVAAVMGLKLAICYRYTGALSGHTGMVLMSFLSANPNMVLELPDGDPDLAKVKAYYAANGTLLGIQSLFGGPRSAELSRMATRLYARAVLSHPVQAAETALTGYRLQNSDNVLFCYPEEANHVAFAASRNVLFVVERRVNWALFGSWRSVVWNSLCLLVALVCLLTAMRYEQRLSLGLLSGFVLYSVVVTNCTFAAFWVADNTRMHVAYEAPLIALWCYVPYRLVIVRWRSLWPGAWRAVQPQGDGTRRRAAAVNRGDG